MLACLAGEADVAEGHVSREEFFGQTDTRRSEISVSDDTDPAASDYFNWHRANQTVKVARRPPERPEWAFDWRLVSIAWRRTVDPRTLLRDHGGIQRVDGLPTVLRVQMRASSPQGRRIAEGVQ